MKLLLYSQSKFGHRQMYLNAFSGIYDCDILADGSKIRNLFKIVFCNKPVLFITVDDSYIYFIICSLFRAILGKKTCGISLYVLHESRLKYLKTKFKLIIQKNFRVINKVRIFSVIPFDMVPLNKFVSDDWIYDPAIWDLNESVKTESDIQETGHDFKFDNNGAPFVLYLGSLDSRKGFREFVHLALLAKLKSTDFEFIAAGPAGISLQQDDLKVFSLCGGYLINRRLTENEVLKLQHGAAVYWACYPESFDQSSGIVGRALQLRKLVIVRKYSLAEKIMNKLNGVSIAVPFDDPVSALNLILQKNIFESQSDPQFYSDHCLHLSKFKIETFLETIKPMEM